MRKIKIILALTLLVTLLFGSLWLYLKFTYPHTPPHTSLLYFLEHLVKPHEKLDKQVLGFLPYWQTKDMPDIKLQTLSEFNYFSLSFDANGDLIQTTGYQTDPGWREWEKQEMKNMVTKAHIMGTNVSLTIASHDNKTIEQFLADTKAHQTLITAIIDQIKTRKLDGIVIDIEYLGEPDAASRDAFVNFSRDLAETMGKETPKATLALALMPREIHDGPLLFEVSKLVPYYDSFIGMSYDYSGSNADSSGPTAPMKGYKEGKYFFDITTTYEEYLEIIPKEKILMGIPYYGWDRAVEDGKTIASNTFPPEDERSYAAIISYARAKDKKAFKPEKCQWDGLAAQTWCWYTKDGVDYQAWLEDDKSLKIKYDFARKQDFAGVAIWILGYNQ